MQPRLKAVTGAAGYLGKYITRLLLADNDSVLNLSGRPERPNEFGERIISTSFNFDQPQRLVESLRGVDTLYNTYWIRFEKGTTTFAGAVDNSRILINSAVEAGVRRIVHISITNPSANSPLPYFRGKALVEQAIKDSGLSYAILRPAVLFGREGILINNIAWFLRHLPVFGIPGKGDYRLQPVFVEDLAKLAVEQGNASENTVMDAVGPEIYRFIDLIALIKDVVNSKTPAIAMPPRLALVATASLGKAMGDVVMTPDEVSSLMNNLLVSARPPTCPTQLSRWLRDNSEWLGREYFSEIAKHYK